MDFDYLSVTENYKKFMTTALWAGVMVIFSGVILIRVEVWAQQLKDEVTISTEQRDLQDYLLQQTTRQIVQKKQFNIL